MVKFQTVFYETPLHLGPDRKMQNIFENGEANRFHTEKWKRIKTNRITQIFLFEKNYVTVNSLQTNRAKYIELNELLELGELQRIRRITTI
jgi:hypothetical protein